jgi:hypothetical protein
MTFRHFRQGDLRADAFEAAGSSAALKGPLFHVSTNGRDILFGLVSIAPSGLCLPHNAAHG